MSEEIDWQTLYTRLNEYQVSLDDIFKLSQLVYQLVEQQKKRIHQLETELIEAKYQLRKINEKGN